jgi:hypothetical protein
MGGGKGVDGWFHHLAANGRIETGVISAEAGDNPNMVRDLGRVMERDKRRFGPSVMKGMPPSGMLGEADPQPVVEADPGRFPALQFVTLAELLIGLKPQLPAADQPVRKASGVEMRPSRHRGALAR